MRHRSTTTGSTSSPGVAGASRTVRNRSATLAAADATQAGVTGNAGQRAAGRAVIGATLLPASPIAGQQERQIRPARHPDEVERGEIERQREDVRSDKVSQTLGIPIEGLEPIVKCDDEPV